MDFQGLVNQDEEGILDFSIAVFSCIRKSKQFVLADELLDLLFSLLLVLPIVPHNFSCSYQRQ
jgi:hypothetical protein